MTTRTLIAFSSLILLLMPPGLSWAQPQRQALCQTSAKNNQLARDQRDTLRSDCLKKNKTKISIPTCLRIADLMEYSTAAEETRLFCLHNLVRTERECLAITKRMEYPDSGDEARWDCLRQFSKNLSKKQCLKVAKGMNYPANADRAADFCKQQHD
ncbi:MAG: hypothetical protein HUU57_02705 [Bdellovibrio sp.]|nr:hypothetical protein [Bdellovibrio sp.]